MPTTRTRAPNPLKQDPTRLAPIRRTFAADLRRRFARLWGAAYALLVRDDALNRGRWATLAPDRQSVAFRDWLESALDTTLLSGNWWEPLVDRAYRQGAGRAYDEVRRAPLRPSAEHAAGREEFLRSLTAGQPVRGLTGNAARARDWRGRFLSERARLLAVRLESELKGATTAAAQEMARVLIDGVQRGLTPRQIAIEMRRRVEIAYKRAVRIANTELTRAHANAQLDAMEELGVDGVTAEVEWETTSGNPCPRCEALSGETYTIDEARGLIPAHPACMCQWAAVPEQKAPERVQTGTEAEIDRLVEEGAAEVWRGVPSAAAGKTTRAGDPRMAPGDYGTAAYYTSARGTAESYAYDMGRKGEVVRAAVRKNARTIDPRSLEELVEREVARGRTRVDVDRGTFARKMGYDVIVEPVRGYYVVVNPRALVVQKTRVRRDDLLRP